MRIVADLRGEPPLGLRERKKKRTRAMLIDAAVELCEGQGFERTTVDQIAAEYDYLRPQAARMKQRARLVVAQGLDAAVRQTSAHRRSPSYGFEGR